MSDGRIRRHLDLGVLDALRGIAALYVLLHHAYQTLWIGYHPFLAYGETTSANALAYVSMQVFRFGTQAVLVFFLISGFCIHYRQSKQLAEARRSGQAAPRFDVAGFARRRARRLYPPFLAALFLTALFDTLGTAIAPGVYAAAEWIGRGHSLAALVGNLLMQSSLASPVFGSDAPLWSLGFEFWFYVLYPILLFTSRRLGAWPSYALVAAVSGVALAAMHLSGIQALGLGTVDFPGFWGLRVLAYFVVWSAGALIADIYTGRIRAPGVQRVAPVAAIVMAAMVIKVARFGPDYKDDFVWSLGFGLGMAYLLLAMPPAAGAAVEWASGKLRFLGDISYSLYIVHYPLLLLVSAWWLGSHTALPLGPELAMAGVALGLGAGWLCWYFVERHWANPRQASGSPRAVNERARSRSTVSQPQLATVPPTSTMSALDSTSGGTRL